MSILSRLALLFVGIPLLELFILVEMGRWIGFLPTVGIVILTGVVGAGLARLEGLRTLWSIQSELARGRLPGDALFDGMAILVGGALLLTPGILTDLLGFSFLLPPTRKLLLRQIRKRIQERLKSGAIHVTYFAGFPGSSGGSRGPGQGAQERGQGGGLPGRPDGTPRGDRHRAEAIRGGLSFESFSRPVGMLDSRYVSSYLPALSGIG